MSLVDYVLFIYDFSPLYHRIQTLPKFFFSAFYNFISGLCFPAILPLFPTFLLIRIDVSPLHLQLFTYFFPRLFSIFFPGLFPLFSPVFLNFITDFFSNYFLDSTLLFFAILSLFPAFIVFISGFSPWFQDFLHFMFSFSSFLSGYFPIYFPPFSPLFSTFSHLFLPFVG